MGSHGLSLRRVCRRRPLRRVMLMSGFEPLTRRERPGWFLHIAGETWLRPKVSTLLCHQHFQSTGCVFLRRATNSKEELLNSFLFIIMLWKIWIMVICHHCVGFAPDSIRISLLSRKNDCTYREANERGGLRSHDPRIKSPMLYQLSYTFKLRPATQLAT